MIFVRTLRRIVRTPALLFWLVFEWFRSVRKSYFHPYPVAVKLMSGQVKEWGRGLVNIFGMKVVVHGDLSQYEKTGGLVISNHTGYMDIFVHGSIFGLRFAPKSDIRSWPVLGFYVDTIKPVWVDRSSRMAAAKTVEEFHQTLDLKVPFIVYPEGTSTDGRSGVLPFKSSVFEMVAGTDYAIQPIVTFYSWKKGDTNPAWYGDMTLFPHVHALLGNGRTRADVYVLPLVRPEGRGRKELSALVYDMISRKYAEVLEEINKGNVPE